MKTLVPNFEVASAKYYRSRLEPTYDKIRAALNEKLTTDCPSTISIGLDGWSQYHHGYLGINAHYINNEWERTVFNLACTPFGEKHTGENIYNKLTMVLEEWKILEKTGLCVRDNASNMVAAFELPTSVLKSIGCLNHSLQLVIKGEIFGLPSVKTLVEKCRNLAGHANMSTSFYTKFYAEQEKQMGITNRQNLKQDVATR